MDGSPRLNRLFAADGKCFDIAVDHGFFGEETFLTGIENMEAALAACDRYAMPLMVEPLIFKAGERGYGADGDSTERRSLPWSAREITTSWTG